MKKKWQISCFTVLVLVIFVTSCKRDEPEVTLDDRDAFVGTWAVSDQQIAKQNYQVYIYKDGSNSEKIWIKNFHCVSDTAYAFVSDKNIVISPQTLAISRFMVGGSGIMTGTTKIDLEYYVNDGADQDTMVARYTKNN